MRTLNPLRWVARLADSFEERGVYVPGIDGGPVQPWREFGWAIVGWIFTIGLFVLFFALAT